MKTDTASDLSKSSQVIGFNVVILVGVITYFKYPMVTVSVI
jgi:hypothetical protein